MFDIAMNFLTDIFNHKDRKRISSKNKIFASFFLKENQCFSIRFNVVELNSPFIFLFCAPLVKVSIVIVQETKMTRRGFFLKNFI